MPSVKDTTSASTCDTKSGTVGCPSGVYRALAPAARKGNEQKIQGQRVWKCTGAVLSDLWDMKEHSRGVGVSRPQKEMESHPLQGENPE